jgi:hypothetical protein
MFKPDLNEKLLNSTERESELPLRMPMQRTLPAACGNNVR